MIDKLRRPLLDLHDRFLLMQRIWLTAILLAYTHVTFGQFDSSEIPDPNPELERRALQLADGFEINLFAADPHIAKPIGMNFDPQGRLWVTSSTTYPQIDSREKPNDKIIILEDTDRDGRADKSTVFADGLAIPHGVAPGDGGAYVASGKELLHLADVDGDGCADNTTVVLSGFGTEDTHHMLHTLRWGPDGMLYMNQSVYIHSHIETRYGLRHMNGAGVWQFRPDTMRLEVFSLGQINPWGHHFDRFGQSFTTDGAGSDGIHYVFPGFVGLHSPGTERYLRGLEPGVKPKYCGIEVISGRHLPPEWRGNILTNDFRAHRVCRFEVTEDGSGFAVRELDELIKTEHVAFRPVDVKMGPDGAIYIADWYNPIISHGEIDFRDPRRDHVHGRIWRVTARQRPLVQYTNLADAPIDQVLDALKAPEQFTRLQAKRALKERGSRKVVPALTAWLAALGHEDPDLEHHRLEALWTCQSLGHVNADLLRSLLAAKDHRVRAAATRVLYQWHASLPDALSLLERLIADEHPRARLEAVRAASRMEQARACEIAMRALDRPLDRFLEFALWKTARELKPYWLPALESGRIDFGGDVRHLTFALEAVGSSEVVPLLLRQLQDREIKADRETAALSTIAALAAPNKLQELFALAVDPHMPAARKARILTALAEAAQTDKIDPRGNADDLVELLEHKSPAVRVAALQTAAAWRMADVAEAVGALAANTQTDRSTRLAAIDAVAAIADSRAVGRLAKIAEGDSDIDSRLTAIAALTKLDIDLAAQHAGVVLQQLPRETDLTAMVEAFLARRDGDVALAKAIADRKLTRDTALLALRVVRTSGREAPELNDALNVAGGLDQKTWQLSRAEQRQFIVEVHEQGNAERGEAIYRRKDLGCIKCHSIAGIGGGVGPDLATIGASSPIDYIIESLLDPNKKIKENFDSTVVLTDDGRVTTGIVVAQSEQEMVLSTANDRQVRIRLDSIEALKKGGSLMPLGLVNSLTRSELIDLVRFLAELGKPGPFAVSTRRFVRRFEVPLDVESNRQLIARQGADMATQRETKLEWQTVYGRVSGSLQHDEVPTFHVSGTNQAIGVLRIRFEALTAGNLNLRIDLPRGLSAWLDGVPQPIAAETVLKLSEGRHVLTLIAEGTRPQHDFQLEMPPSPDAAARVQFDRNH